MGEIRLKKITKKHIQGYIPFVELYARIHERFSLVVCFAIKNIFFFFVTRNYKIRLIKIENTLIMYIAYSLTKKLAGL